MRNRTISLLSLVLLTALAGSCASSPVTRPEGAPRRTPPPTRGGSLQEGKPGLATASASTASASDATPDHQQQAMAVDPQGNESPGDNPLASSESSGGSEVSTKPAPSAPLPVGTKVLHVGDSFAGALGLPLGKQLEAVGVSSVLKHRDSSYLTDWAWDKTLQPMLWRYNPDLVLITLGGNELGIGHPEKRQSTVKKIVSTLAGRPCVWIAVPLWDGPQNGLMDVIEQSVAPCVFLDTNKLYDVKNMARITDGVHPTKKAREEWAHFVYQWLLEHRDPQKPNSWSFN